MPLTDLDNLAAYQFGLVTTDQARDYMSDGQWRHLIKRGDVLPVRRGVYRMVGVDGGFHQQVASVVLSIGVGTVASHRTAARLWGLAPGFDTDEVEVTMPPLRSVRRRGIRLRRSVMAMSHATMIGCIPVTTVARTLVDLAACCPAERIEIAVDDALRRKLTTLEELVVVFEEVNRPGRPRCRRFAKLLDARAAHRTQSHLERRVLKQVKKRRLPLPNAQHRVASERRSFDLDFAWPAQKVAVEVQGYRWHGQRSDFDRDSRRLADLAALGWAVVPITSRTIDEGLTAVEQLLRLRS